MEDLKNAVLVLLKAKGVDTSRLSDNELSIYVKNEITNILAYINRKELPKTLEHVVVQRVMGVVLKNLLYFNKLEIDGEKIDSEVVGSISRGDVSMTFKNNGTITEKISNEINELLNYGSDLLNSERVFKW